MAGVTKKNFGKPDETRNLDKTRVDVVGLGTATAGCITLQPGWRWSECIKPAAKTERCQNRHVGTVTSGRLHVAHDDGTEVDLVPGDAYVIDPGHDAWVVGAEPFTGYEFESKTAETYAQPS